MITESTTGDFEFGPSPTCQSNFVCHEGLTACKALERKFFFNGRAGRRGVGFHCRDDGEEIKPWKSEAGERMVGNGGIQKNIQKGIRYGCCHM